MRGRRLAGRGPDGRLVAGLQGPFPSAAWLWAAIPIAIVILVKWPRSFLVLIPVVVLALALFKPRFGGGRRPR